MPTRQLKRVIFLVEDEVSQRLLYRFCLENEGFLVLDFVSGEEALAALDAHRPGLICIDFNLPKMNGLDLVSAVRRRRPGTAILLLTAADDPGSLDQIAEAQVDSCLNKPVELEDLAKEARRLLATRVS